LQGTGMQRTIGYEVFRWMEQKQRRTKQRREKMAAAKKTAKRTTKKRTTGRTEKVTETFKVPRSAKQLAEAVWLRMRRSPDYLRQVVAIVSALERAANSTAQVMPRSNGSAEAAH
jgi:hypothetical protein